MQDSIHNALRQYFGYSQLLPGQQEVMQQLLNGQSAAAVFPTGGGKSLCYQLPALLLPGVTLVVSPLIALMKDQIDALDLRITPVIPEDRDQALLSSIRKNPDGPSIVYVTQQKTAESVARTLADAGLPARAYHAGMKTDLRNQVQEWFMGADDAIVVTTIAFGMGVDKAGIRAVYHYNLPKSLENYSQEIGRAGRDGETSICQCWFAPKI